MDEHMTLDEKVLSILKELAKLADQADEARNQSGYRQDEWLNVLEYRLCSEAREILRKKD